MYTVFPLRAEYCVNLTLHYIALCLCFLLSNRDLITQFTNQSNYSSYCIQAPRLGSKFKRQYPESAPRGGAYGPLRYEPIAGVSTLHLRLLHLQATWPRIGHNLSASPLPHLTSVRSGRRLATLTFVEQMRSEAARRAMVKSAAARIPLMGCVPSATCTARASCTATSSRRT